MLYLEHENAHEKDVYRNIIYFTVFKKNNKRNWPRFIPLI